MLSTSQETEVTSILYTIVPVFAACQVKSKLGHPLVGVHELAVPAAEEGTKLTDEVPRTLLARKSNSHKGQVRSI